MELSATNRSLAVCPQSWILVPMGSKVLKPDNRFHSWVSVMFWAHWFCQFKGWPSHSSGYYGLLGFGPCNNKWANALVPPTPFQGWRKKCADIEPLKKPSKRLGRNIVKHTYVYIYITLYVFHSQKWNDDRNWGILMTSLWRRHQDEILWNTPRHPRPSNAHVSCWDRCSYSCFICAKGCEGLSW